MAFYELYRVSTLGSCLMDALDDMIRKETLPEHLKWDIMQQFDKDMNDALQNKVSNTNTTIKGHLHTYRYVDNVWTFNLSNPTFTFRLAGTGPGETLKVAKAKIVVCDGKILQQTAPNSTAGADHLPQNDGANDSPLPSTSQPPRHPNRYVRKFQHLLRKHPHIQQQIKPIPQVDGGQDDEDDYNDDLFEDASSGLGETSTARPSAAKRSDGPPAKRRKADKDKDKDKDKDFEDDDDFLGADDDDQENGGVEAAGGDEELGSADDSNDEEESDEDDGENLVLAQYEKVQRTRNRWKCQFKGGIMNLNGKDILFKSAKGDFEF